MRLCAPAAAPAPLRQVLRREEGTLSRISDVARAVTSGLDETLRTTSALSAK